MVWEIPYFSATFLYEKDSPGFKDLIYKRAAFRDIVVEWGVGVERGGKVGGVARVVTVHGTVSVRVMRGFA